MAWMLDTNTVSDLVKGHPRLLDRVRLQPMEDLCLSAITEAELRFGLAKRPQAKHLHLAVQELLLRVKTEDWTARVAQCYGPLRAHMESCGPPMGALDLQIAAHALALDATLVSRDKAFENVPGLRLVDWTL